MAKNKTKKQTSIYVMAMLVVALAIAGIFIYLWTSTFTPASEASTGPAPEFTDYTNTLHHNDRVDTLVLATIKSYVTERMNEDLNYKGDPILRTEEKLKEIRDLIMQAKNMIATVTGETITPIEDDKPIDETPIYVTPIDDDNDNFGKYRNIEIPEEDIDEPIVDDDDEPVITIEDPIFVDEPIEIEPEQPKTWLQKTGDSVKSFLGHATDTVKGWFGIKKQTSPIIKPASLSSFKAENLTIGGAKIVISGKNLKINDLKNTAPEKGSKLTIFFDDFSNRVFKDTEFLVWHDNLTAYSSSAFKEVTQVYFESPTLGMQNTQNGTTITQPVAKPEPTAPATGGEPQTESIQSKTSLYSFKAENLAIGGAKIVISGKNLKINNLKNTAPEKGSKLTVFFDDFSNKVHKDTEFLVWHDSITVYSSEKIRKVIQIYFESPTLGTKSTQKGTTVTQVPLNQPKITEYKVEHYNIYETLIIKGENLLISSNRSNNDEQVLVMLKDRNSNTYNSNQFYGSKDTVYIIGAVDEFKNIDTIYFESKSRGLTSTTNQISFVNIANFFVGKAMAATTEISETPFGIKATNRENAFDELRDEIDSVLAQFETYGDALSSYVFPNSTNTNDSSTGLLVREGVGDMASSGPASMVNKLESAKSSLSHLKRNDPVIKMWEAAAKYQANGALPFDFDIKYSSSGVVYMELTNSNTSLINEIANSRATLDALSRIGRSPGGIYQTYDTPAWIGEAKKTAKNTSSFGSNTVERAIITPLSR